MYDNNTVFLDALHPDMLTKLNTQHKNLRDFSWVSSGAISSVKNQVSSVKNQVSQLSGTVGQFCHEPSMLCVKKHN